MLEIKKIILCSDQHVRLFKRHTEYQQVFNRFFKYIDSVKDENTVICLGGDRSEEHTSELQSPS